MNRAERLNEAYNYLRDRGFIHKQKDLAEKMGASPSNISSALKGVEEVLTDKFLHRFNQSFEGIFDIDWLLYGEGEMIRSGVSQHATGDNNTQVAGNSNHVNNSSTLDKALNEISEMRKLLEKSIQNNKEQADRFFAIIEKMQGV